MKPEDLTTCDLPLVSFDGKVVIPRGQIRLLMQASTEVMEVDFIVVDAYSPIHFHCGKALASCPKGHLFNSALEGEIPLERPD